MGLQQIPSKGGIPSGNTASRPGSPVIGDTYYNGQLELLEIYNGTAWVASSAPPAVPTIATPTSTSGASAYTSTAGSLAVVFTPGSGGSTATQYNAFTTAGGFSASSASTTVTLTGLTPGTAYTVYGNAQNNFGTTTNTANASAATPTTKPQAPTIGTATLSGADVVVTWTLNATGGSALTGITITPYIGATAQTPVSAATTSSTSHTVTGLTAGTTYTFKVKTTNANGDSPESSATNSVATPILIDYLLVAGGGGCGYTNIAGNLELVGGGGAGGYRNFTNQSVALSTNYTITVGAGGAPGSNGGDSRFNTNYASGGGRGANDRGAAGANGGSGGGAGDYNSSGGGGSGNSGGYTPVEGYAGSPSVGSPSGANGLYDAGAGGGSGGAAVQTSAGPCTKGPGTANSITGSSITYATGASPIEGNGAANRGDGAGSSTSTAYGTGGSGILVLKYPTSLTATFSGGVTQTTATVSGYKVSTVTAAGVSDTVSWA